MPTVIAKVQPKPNKHAEKGKEMLTIKRKALQPVSPSILQEPGKPKSHLDLQSNALPRAI